MVAEKGRSTASEKRETSDIRRRDGFDALFFGHENGNEVGDEKFARG